MNKRCESKRRYDTEFAAEQALHRIKSGGSNVHTECRYYLCYICCKYHLTSQKKKSK